MKLIALAFALTLASAAASTAAHADGFSCGMASAHVKIIHHNHSGTGGTRKAAVMIISNPNHESGKTIARFTDEEGLLSNSGATYTAKVDKRFNDNSEGGENFAGTKLKFIKDIKVEVNSFAFGDQHEDGDEFHADLYVDKADGSEIQKSMNCEYNKKGE